MKLALNQIVKNSKMPSWSIGIVVSYGDNSTYNIYFHNVGIKRFHSKQNPLIEAIDDIDIKEKYIKYFYRKSLSYCQNMSKSLIIITL